MMIDRRVSPVSSPRRCRSQRISAMARSVGIWVRLSWLAPERVSDEEVKILGRVDDQDW
jgi:hypothetical protein